MKIRATLLFCSALIGLAGIYYSAAGQSGATRKTPQSIADAFDTLIQPRFQIDAGVFGMGRIGVPGHEPIVYDDNDRTHFLANMAAINRHSGRTATIGFLHCIRKPGKFKPSDDSDTPPDVKELAAAKPFYAMYYVVKNQVYDNGTDGGGTDEANAWTKQNSAAVQAACLQALPALRQGKPQAAQVNGMLVVMRPVLALQASCIGCHSGAKRGDTLGAMVYTVTK
jgi:hypothetical protein